MNKKASIELSTSFIVMLLLAIIVFGFGLYFTSQLFGKANELKADMDRNTEAQLESLMDQGLPVAFPIQSKDAKEGTATFGLGVINQLDGPKNFEVKIVCKTVTDINGENELDGAIVLCDQTKTLISQPAFSLEKNEKKKISIGTQVGSNRGIYVFEVSVTANGDLYGGSSKQIYVKVN